MNPLTRVRSQVRTLVRAISFANLEAMVFLMVTSVLHTMSEAFLSLSYLLLVLVADLKHDHSIWNC